MALDNFKPTLWSGVLLRELQKAQIFASVCNRNYEGLIADAGDTVKITQIGNVTVGDYTVGTDISWQTLQDASTTLSIDQQKYFAFKIDDIDKKQAAGEVVTEAMSKAAYELSDSQDQYIRGLYTQAGIIGDAYDMNLGDSTTEVDIAADGGGSNVKPSEWLSRMTSRANIANVPKEGRWMVIPSQLTQKMIMEKIYDYRGVDNENSATNGYLTRLFGWDIYESNNVYTNGTYYVPMAGYGGSITLAEQIVKTEALRLENSFDDGLRGLLVYGAKVIRPDALLASYITIQDEATS